jgi:hypothetical protein
VCNKLEDSRIFKESTPPPAPTSHKKKIPKKSLGCVKITQFAFHQSNYRKASKRFGKHKE